MVAALHQTALVGLQALPVQPGAIGTVEVAYGHPSFLIQAESGVHTAHRTVIQYLIHILLNLTHNTGKIREVNLLSPIVSGSIETRIHSGIPAEQAGFCNRGL